MTDTQTHTYTQVNLYPVHALHSIGQTKRPLLNHSSSASRTDRQTDRQKDRNEILKIQRLLRNTRYRPHSIILASCKPGCKPGFRAGLQPGFRQVHAGLRHAFDQLSTFLSKTWSRTATGSLVCARVRQMECRKKTRSKQVRSWLSTFFRPACDQVFDQVCSLLE